MATSYAYVISVSNKTTPRRAGDDEEARVTETAAHLADRFTDLHKTHWKAAHEELSHVLGDKQTVRHLLWIIAVGLL